jgi:hypothetical protein
MLASELLEQYDQAVDTSEAEIVNLVLWCFIFRYVRLM